MGRPVKWGGTIRLRCIHIDLLLQQGPYSPLISPPDRLDKITAGSGKAREEKQWYHPQKRQAHLEIYSRPPVRVMISDLNRVETSAEVRQ